MWARRTRSSFWTGLRLCRVRLCPPYGSLLKPEHEQHGLVAHFPQLRRVRMPALGDWAEPRQDRDILLAVDLERHRRRVEAAADVDLPQRLHGRVVVGYARSVGAAADDQ